MGNNKIRIAAAVMAALLAAGCRPSAPQALGTLEWDRVSLPAPVAEKIVRIDVREGQRVEAGAPLLQLELTRTRSQLAAAQAQAQQTRAMLDELQAGPRSEAIAQARANLAAVQAQASDARAYYARLQPLGRQQLVAAAEVDRARAAAGNAEAQVRAAQQALLELQRGTRSEQIAQGESALAAAQAQADVQTVTLEKLNVVAPRAGRVDSLPYKLGDQAPVGAPLAILLVGEAPYARIYVPEPLRAGVQVGDAVQVHVDGRERPYPGRIRMIRSEPGFTPYYALTGKDAARLSYLAEVSLGAEAADLPAGFPVRVEFDKAAERE
ncbi:HlyD family secretion protein [Pseudoxanthomonas wuyuanensis]|uniref:HlyD family secretion protein n=1 Tax=Pseudoxanthomonas wuyuanensis TaxID=1073196 RepID=A0A286DCY3_9GAMM|nr:HlyD family efflux transporter periplasmic adaptor subunit [Pseudoxanthomonas wuyuanensis]KAF1720746.1 hemolysin secretion protein D [Pseudoxanthomonas wuyuanensis]SOD56515.1 HlyD family secretion protein [Pseudoxanthomonas wuyuanensis]